MGPLIDRAAREQFRSTIAELRQTARRSCAAARLLERAGFYRAADAGRAENHWECVQRETFAPFCM
jgi:acyl-CoA reductase-like NAD-dependent aldehyde dehydrogenase